MVPSLSQIPMTTTTQILSQTRGRGYMTMVTTTDSLVSEEEEGTCMGKIMDPEEDLSLIHI